MGLGNPEAALGIFRPGVQRTVWGCFPTASGKTENSPRKMPRSGLSPANALSDSLGVIVHRKPRPMNQLPGDSGQNLAMPSDSGPCLREFPQPYKQVGQPRNEPAV